MKKVGENWSTVSTQRNTDCLFKNTPNKHKKYAINQKLKHFDDISFREMLGRNRVFFFFTK